MMVKSLTCGARGPGFEPGADTSISEIGYLLLPSCDMTERLLKQHNPTKNQGVFVKHYAPGGNKVQKAIFSFKVKVKVTRTLSFESFERWSMHAKYEVSISYGSKVIAKVKVDNRQTDKQTHRTKTICPRSFDPGA